MHAQTDTRTNRCAARRSTDGHKSKDPTCQCVRWAAATAAAAAASDKASGSKEGENKEVGCMVGYLHQIYKSVKIGLRPFLYTYFLPFFSIVY